MKLRLRAITALLVVLAAVALAAGCGGTSNSTASPIHVAAEFVDGVNHGDFRQTCSVWESGRKHAAQCQAYLTSQFAQAAFFGLWGGYSIKPGSQKVWTQGYKGGTVELATVTMIGPGGTEYTMRLRRHADGRWYVWYIA